MPVTITVRPDLGIMFANFSGHAKASEAVTAFESYQSHPAYSAGQKHLINFSEVTSFEGDFTKLMALQAKLLEAVLDEQQVLFVFCAPSTVTMRMAQHSVNVWTNVDKVITRVLATEADTMDVIGLPGATFADLMKEPA